MARCTYCKKSWTARNIYKLLRCRQGQGMPCTSCHQMQYMHLEHQGYLLSIGYLNRFLTGILLFLLPWYTKLSHYETFKKL
ncbi:NapC/NirT family cytochrome c [Exiguobacterium sp. 17-1]|uniref:NapC/NirT family cytochrome c n=1 Tax=Exiguobacterium sp. 17-1 TaxID=2931981 RepID=UPI001FFEE838|nr:NapC/NirT family cytochrome c [Exiguobacterium sp. 17-1]MCK2156583.1 NapC/NirT family cytochrome c [Exiguobacterium sp. 17-1]